MRNKVELESKLPLMWGFGRPIVQVSSGVMISNFMIIHTPLSSFNGVWIKQAAAYA